MTIGANFEIINFTITVNIFGSGSVVVTGATEIPDGLADNSTLYNSDALNSIQLTATPTTGDFLYWEVDDVQDEENPYNIPSLEQNYIINVYFGE